MRPADQDRYRPSGPHARKMRDQPGTKGERRKRDRRRERKRIRAMKEGRADG